MDYDVIIAGGSFAGLAAAVQLRGKRVLLIEPNRIGAVQTSACATPLSVLEATRTQDSLLQVHRRIILHTPRRVFAVKLPYPFCTFDYQTFCRQLLAQTDARVLQARVIGRRGHIVYTTRGSYDAAMLIDATGWRAALATNGRLQTAPPRDMSFGVETEVPLDNPDLYFWYEPDRLLPKGVTWLFPIGDGARAGIASYDGHTRISKVLVNWLNSDLGQRARPSHGGYFPHRRRPPCEHGVLCVGDAAGQCLPLTGEGIRPALYFGTLAGMIARSFCEGAMSEAQALKQYQRFVQRHSAFYSLGTAAQKLLTNIPVSWMAGLGAIIERGGLFPQALNAYRRAIDPRLIALRPAEGRIPHPLIQKWITA